MKKEDILKLGVLARIKVTDEEAASLESSFNDILGYVGAVNDLAADQEITKKVGAVYNVFRSDEVTNAAGEYTETLLDAAPNRKENMLVVKKILQSD